VSATHSSGSKLPRHRFLSITHTAIGSVKTPGIVFQMVRTDGFGGFVAHLVERSCD